jgi:CHAT domain-containing protein/tetratricopeptide (TPR) repeat protein
VDTRTLSGHERDISCGRHNVRLIWRIIGFYQRSGWFDEMLACGFWDAGRCWIRDHRLSDWIDCIGMNMLRLRLGALLVVSLVLQIATSVAQTPDDIVKLRQRAEKLFNARNYAEALAAQRTVVAAVERQETVSRGEPRQQTAEALGGLSRYALFAREPAEALAASERARQVAERNALELSYWDATSLLFLGRFDEAQERYLTYKGVVLHFLNYKGESFAPEDPRVGYRWFFPFEEGIADDFDELRRAGVNHDEFPRILWELGIERPELNEELDAARGKVDQLEQTSGPDHPDLATALVNLAKLYRGQRRLTKAGMLFERNLVISEKARGSNHIDVAVSLDNLADLHWEQGHRFEAEQLDQRSLAIREKVLGTEHPDLATALDVLAARYLSLPLRKATDDSYKKAEALYKRSLSIREKTLGSVHPAVAKSLNSLVELYVRQGESSDYIEFLYHRSRWIVEKALGRGFSDPATRMDALGERYQYWGFSSAAENLYERGLDIREKALGPKHLQVAKSLSQLSELYRAQGRYDEAVVVSKRSLNIREKLLGPKHPDVATSLSNLSELYRAQSRYAEAEPLQQRSLFIREKALGPEHPDVAASLSNLVDLYLYQGRTAEAQALLRRSLAILQKARGRGEPDEATVLKYLADRYQALVRYVEAEALYKRSLDAREKLSGPDHLDVAATLDSLATLYVLLLRDAEAEPLLRRSLAIREKALGAEHLEVAQSLFGLGLVIMPGFGESLLKRSLAIREKVLGRDHPDVARSLYQLADVYLGQHRDRLAKVTFQRSLRIFEKTLGPDHPEVAKALYGLAQTYGLREGERGELVYRSLKIREKVLGPDHPDVAMSLNSLATSSYSWALRDDSDARFAEEYFKRSLSILEKALGTDHPNVGWVLLNLGFVSLQQSDWTRAVGYWQRGTEIFKRHAEHILKDAVEDSASAQSHSGYWYEVFSALLRTNLSASPAEKFEIAQWLVTSQVSAALTQMAARSLAGSSELATLARQRQDLASKLRVEDRLLMAEKSKTPTERRPDAEKELSERLADLDKRVAAIDRRLDESFPAYSSLTRPIPLSVVEVQAQLGADEALVLFRDTPEWRWKGQQSLSEETFIGVVTKSEVYWVRSERGTDALKREVAALRCGLDSALWDNTYESERCVELVKRRPSDAVSGGKFLPFDLERAHALYKDLFGEVEEVIKGKHLLIVPSGALTQLPFQILVTQPPNTAVPEGPAGYQAAAWFGARHPITVLPAVSSLKALRAHARTSGAAKAYLGIGNPLLEGDRNDAGDVYSAKLARAKEICVQSPIQMAALGAAVRARGGVARVAMRGGLADVTEIRSLAPLPETADELCAVARDLKADTGEMRLGSRATETEVKRLSAGGELATYRVLHFATHGVMAGELTSAHEPGLVLTPPDEATAEDDGYLSVSEIAALKLDADWVILSACNTAAGGAVNAEALSGVARAFLYAGAHALLVSHWAVYSDATVKLVTKAAGEMAANVNVGRAEAMRRAMQAMIEKGGVEAHPAYWAPFVVVGEGAVR